MSALVETMFSVREKVWHGLGRIIEHAPISEDAIVAAGLDWNVIQEPLFKENGVSVPGYFANVRDSDGAILGVVTGKYTIVQNKEAFAFTDGLVDEGMVYETAGSLRGGKQIWLLGRMPEIKILDDDFEQYICFTNTHDGTGAVRVCCTPTRVVCANTLNLALSTAKRSWSAVHRGSMESKLVEAKLTLGLINDYTDALKIEAERLAAIKITDETVEGMLDNIYHPSNDDSEVRRRRIDMLKQTVFGCLMAEDIKQYRGTAYSVIMAATDFADHSAPLRETANYKENRWGQIMVGHPFVDQMYKQIVAAA